MPHAGCSIVAIVMRSKSGQCWEPEKGNLLKEQDIRRIRDNTPGASTPDSAARTVPRRSLTAAGPKRVSARQLAVVDLVL